MLTCQKYYNKEFGEKKVYAQKWLIRCNSSSVQQYIVSLAKRSISYHTFGGKWFDSNALVLLNINCKNKLAS